MLSAIAARKAAQAARLVAQPTEPPVGASTTISEESASESEQLKDILWSNKRKPSLSNPGESLTSRKKKKVSRAATKSSRYFQDQDEPDVLGDQDDVIIVDSRIEESSGSSSDEDGVVDGSATGGTNDAVRVDAARGGAETPFRRRKRAWSPSQPVQESSDEDMMDEDTAPAAAATSSAPHTRDERPTPVTTFVPNPGGNFRCLDASEAGRLVGGVSGGKGAIVALSGGTTLALVGGYTFCVLLGAVSVCGVDVCASPTSHRVFAPQCAPLPVLCALGPTAARPVPAKSWVADIPRELRHLFDGTRSDAVVLLRELRTGVEGLGIVCKTFDGVFEFGGREEDALKIGSACIVFRQPSYFQPFLVPSTWSHVMSSVNVDLDKVEVDALGSQPTVALIKGPKRTGKSTFARMLLNHLTTIYRRVAFLECDLGQTDFSPPGMVALHIVEQPVFGPSYCHPAIPFRAHFVGSTSPRSSPSHYLAAIKALLETYKSEIQYSEVDYTHGVELDGRIDAIVPLVVNTMGWTKGLGADLSRQVDEIVEPTHILTMRAHEFAGHDDVLTTPQRRHHTQARYSVSSGLRSDGTHAPVSYDLEPISSAPLAQRYTAADWRNISLMSYFHARFPQTSPSPSPSHILPRATIHGATTWTTTLPLLARAPYAVTPRTAFDSVVLVGPGSEDVVAAEIGRVLNGAVVGLVQCEPGSLDVSSAPGVETRVDVPYAQGAAPPDPQTSTCIGVALVRAVPPSPSEVHEIHVITPIPPALLASARCVVKGELELPVWGMLDFREGDRSRERQGGGDRRFERGAVPYLQWGRGEGVGAERRRVRRNLMRRAQL